MHFFWDNRGPKDIIGSFCSDVFEPRTSTRNEPFSILNCLDTAKFVLISVFTLIETICANIFFKITAQECKSPRPVEERHSTTSQLKLPRNGIDGRTDG